LSIVSPSSQAERLSLAVGHTVVYAAHGVGCVVAHDRRFVAGAERDCIVVDLGAGLRVTLSVEDAVERLRAVVDDAELASVQRTLADAPARRDGSWTRRLRDNKAKLAAGRATDLAELVRDGVPFEKGEKGLGRLSDGERRLYLQARQLLVREVSSARGIAHEEADGWIEAQLAPPQESGG
jgi:RNA polymerase-interacting CarD/CdnL/TRCF family regulator